LYPAAFTTSLGGSGVERVEIYSPTQVACAAFFGGPLAGVFVLWRNFRALGDDDAARRMLIWGAVLAFALLLIVPFLPDWFPNLLIPLAYALAARSFAQNYQLSKSDIEASEQYTFQSIGNVVIVSVAALLVFLIIAVFWILALAYFGLID
jgi:hypothetical protein